LASFVSLLALYWARLFGRQSKVVLELWNVWPESESNSMLKILEAPDTVSPTIAQQMFVIGSGIAGGLGGIVLARKFTNVREVKVPVVAVATLVSIVATVGTAVWLSRSAEEV
jgi:hypothetical protein